MLVFMAERASISQGDMVWRRVQWEWRVVIGNPDPGVQVDLCYSLRGAAVSCGYRDIVRDVKQ